MVYTDAMVKRQSRTTGTGTHKRSNHVTIQKLKVMFTQNYYTSLIHLLTTLCSNFLKRSKKMRQRACSFFWCLSGGSIQDLGTYPGVCSKRQEQAGQEAKSLDTSGQL